MKISIIVPIHNVENYVKECIKSIISQTYEDYELLLIDDGSTDSSGKICDEFAKKNNKIKVIHKENGGLSDARNVGIKSANGQYIMFVDGDDYLIDSYNLQSIVNELTKENVDVLQYKMQYYYEKSKKILKLKNIAICCDTDVKKCLKKLNENGQVSVSACDKIIRTDVIKKNELYFKKGIYSEDIDWSLRLYLKIKSIKITNLEIYSYRQQRKGSITNKTTKKGMRDLYNIINNWYNYKFETEEMKEIYYNYLAYQYLILVTKSKKIFFNKEEILMIKYYEKELLKYDDIYKVKRVNKLKNICGFYITIFFLRVYLFLKNNNLYKM